MEHDLVSLRTIAFVAGRQLAARKLLNGIAMAGVMLGVLVLIGTNGILNGLHEKFLDAILRISPHVVLFDEELRPRPSALERWMRTPVTAEVAHEVPAGLEGRLNDPSGILRSIRALPTVAAAAVSVDGPAVLENGGKSRSIELRGIVPLEQERVTALRPFVVAGRFGALRNEDDGLVVGKLLADLLGIHVGDLVRVSAARGTPLHLRVVAVYESGVPPVDRTRCFVLLRNAQAALGRTDSISRIEVRLRDPEDADVVARQLEALFRYRAESWHETYRNYLSAFRLQDVTLGIVTAALLVVGGFGVLAVQVMIVLQKQRDIAIMRSFGLRRSDVLWTFLLQGTVISFAGGLAGDLTGHLLLLYLRTLPIHFEGSVKADTLLVAEEPRAYLYGLIVAVVLGVAATAVPAWRAARVEPVGILRGQN